MIKIFRYWYNQILKYSDIEIFRYWNIHILKYSDIEILRYWNIQILKHTDIGIMGWYNMTHQCWDIEKNGIYLIYCSTQLLIDISNKLVLEFYTRGKKGPREVNKTLSCDWSAEPTNICETAHLNSSNLTTKINSKIVVDVWYLTGK